jgi:hypothetical protein
MGSLGTNMVNPRPIARRLAAIAAALGVAALFAQPVLATEPVTGTGTYEDIGADLASVRNADGNTFVHLIVTGRFHGAVEGIRIVDAITVLHPNGLFDAHGTATCDCTVAGRSGTWLERFTASGITDVSVVVKFTVVDGTGGLSNLRAVGMASGVPGGGGTYSIDYHFDG